MKEKKKNIYIYIYTHTKNTDYIIVLPSHLQQQNSILALIGDGTGGAGIQGWQPGGGKVAMSSTRKAANLYALGTVLGTESLYPTGQCVELRGDNMANILICNIYTVFKNIFAWFVMYIYP